MNVGVLGGCGLDRGLARACAGEDQRRGRGDGCGEALVRAEEAAQAFLLGEAVREEDRDRTWISGLELRDPLGVAQLR